MHTARRPGADHQHRVPLADHRAFLRIDAAGEQFGHTCFLKREVVRDSVDKAIFHDVYRRDDILGKPARACVTDTRLRVDADVPHVVFAVFAFTASVARRNANPVTDRITGRSLAQLDDRTGNLVTDNPRKCRPWIPFGEDSQV